MRAIIGGVDGKPSPSPNSRRVASPGNRVGGLFSAATHSERTAGLIFFSPCHSALHPFIAQLERAAGFARDDTPEAKLAKLRVLLVPGSRDDEDIALLTELLRAVDQRLKAGQFAAARSALKINPARRIYERLGFNVTYEDQHKVYMRREPDRMLV